jgi:uncharacterized protein (TIGR00299 family) protein
LPKALYYDCFSGISGDMHLGALLDLGVPDDWLRAQLARLKLPDEFELSQVPDRRKGIAGIRATVHIDPQVKKPHRHLSQIAELIHSAGLEASVEERAIAVFRTLAGAEAAVHGQDIEQVHFHEVGATDAIVDIVGGVLGLHYLEPERIFCGPVEVGSGTVRCDHGLLPVPAPATARLLQDVPCHYGRVDGEATTPTGAALLKTLVTDFALPDAFVAERWGHGVGQKDFAVANVLRVALGTTEPASVSAWDMEENIALAADLDDLSPEACEPLLEALWAAGVLDVQITPTAMKKQRPGFRLSALLQPELQDQVLATLFEHSSTIGARTHRVSKWMLPRREVEVATPVGTVRAKIVTLPDGTERHKVEHDDIRACSTPERGYLRTRAIVERAVTDWLAGQS